MKKTIFFICLSSIFAANALIAGSTDLPWIFLPDISHDLIDYQINNGKNIPEFTLHQPYHTTVFHENKNSSNSNKYFSEYWSDLFFSNGLAANIRLQDKIKFRQDAAYNRYGGEIMLHYLSDHILLVNHTGIDQEYKYDPLFAGDLSEAEHWIYGRVNNAFINLNFGNFDFFLGRTKRNLGPINSPSLILSDNSYSYDHFYFSYTARKIKLSLLFARLEDLDAVQAKGVPVITEIIDQPDSRKYLAGHRLDVRFSDKFQIAFSEFTTFGGPDRDFDLSFMNPVTFYYPLQRNDGKINNGKWVLDAFYKPIQRITLYSQFLIDDIIVNNDPGVDDRGRFPDRLAAYFSFRTGDFLLPGLNTDISYTRVWNRTYQALLTWENYHYRGLGLGYPTAGSEELKLKFSYWGIFPFYIKNEFILGRYGNVRLTDYFPLEKESFPVGPVIHNMVNILDLYYFVNSRLQFFFRLENYRNADHYLNRLNQNSVYTASIGLKLIIGKGFKM